MSTNILALTDGFNTLCAEQIGSGLYRNVFAMRFNPALVVKIENEPSRRWCNVLEWTLWQDWQDYDAVARWLAPCRHLSDGGHVLIMDRTRAALATELPRTLPAFLTDVKPANYGFIGNRFVCHDYAFTVTEMRQSRRRVSW